MESAMPNIRNIAWEQRPSLTPVGTIIVADLAHAIRVIHTGAFPPLRIILDPIGLIRHKQRVTEPSTRGKVTGASRVTGGRPIARWEFGAPAARRPRHTIHRSRPAQLTAAQ